MRTASPNNIPLDGKVYIHATDTCYGFAARWDDEDGIKIIRELKGREEQKPMSLLFANIAMLQEFCEINTEQLEFIVAQNQPSSFILKKKEILINYFPEQENVSVRIENESFPIRLSALLQSPITSTSVNKNGETPLYNTQSIKEIFSDTADTIVLINSGEIAKIPPSNIWNLTNIPYIKVR